LKTEANSRCGSDSAKKAIITMSLTVHNLGGDHPSYLLTFLYSATHSPFRIVLDPTLTGTSAHRPSVDPQLFQQPANIETIADLERVPDIALLSSSYINDLSRTRLVGSLDWELVPRLLTDELNIPRMERWAWFPHEEKLHGLKHLTPYVRFIGGAHAKVEIELLGDGDAYGAAFGFRFCHKPHYGADWRVLTVLLAPNGLSRRAAHHWCLKLGEKGIDRFKAEEWLTSPTPDLEQHQFNKGYLDVLVHPHNHIEKSILDHLNSRGAERLWDVVELCHLVDIRTFILTYDGAQKKTRTALSLLKRVSQTFPKSAAEARSNGNQVWELEEALRRTGVPLRVTETGPGTHVMELDRGIPFVLCYRDDPRLVFHCHPGIMWLP
jgi:hypothetical protein